MEQRSSGLQQGNNLLTQRSYVANAKAITCFSYIPTISTNAPRHTMGKGYRDLAASIGSTTKLFTSTI